MAFEFPGGVRSKDALIVAIALCNDLEDERPD